MDCEARFLPYHETHAFSPLVLDYISGKEALRPFYRHAPDMSGLRNAIEERMNFPTDRPLLVAAIQKTHAGTELTAKQKANILALSSPQTFTVCTAHQPNIFSGFLYFVYKILHAVRLAEAFREEAPECDFVPVFCIGSEDNDLDELSQFRLHGVKRKWETKQEGAVGRMKVDKGLLDLILQVEAGLGSEPFGHEISQLLRDAYPLGASIADATTMLIQRLFADYGLLVLQPDQPELKRAMIPVFRDELNTQRSFHVVNDTIRQLEPSYKVQVNPREINLFYLEEGGRHRILRDNDSFLVDATARRFTSAEILEELDAHPERFSPNVVLRGLYQETILPNIAFIGGGSEIAYWLELQALFDHYRVPYPMLVLRNSFLLVTPVEAGLLEKSGWTAAALFRSEMELMNDLARQQAGAPLDLRQEIYETIELFRRINGIAGTIDPTLVRHVSALEKKSVDRLRELEKKMLRAEKRKHEVSGQQLRKIRSALFPGNSLQERYENILPYYARYGKDIIDCIHQHSKGLEMVFGLITIR